MPKARPSGRTHARAGLPCALLSLLAASAIATPLKVDINNSGRPVAEGLDPAFTPWGNGASWLPADANTTSATFGELTVTFTRVGPVGTALQTGYWKSGLQDTARNLKLTADGLKVKGGEAGAQIEMRLKGLKPGRHTLLLHLNNWDSTPSNGPLDILVDGTRVVDDLPVSTQETDAARTTSAFLPIDAAEGREVVVLIAADPRGKETARNVHINGFEIDTPNSKSQASTPSPADGDEHVDADSGKLQLAWNPPALGATAHKLYIGTNASALLPATPNAGEASATPAATRFALDGVRPDKDYFWRVDTVAADGTVTPGNVWHFRARRLAFPGAEGYGRFARGGRGGVVRHVTNLNDAGPGSLRDAIEGDYGPRTVVFDVSGLITLQSDILLGATRPYITIGGQTAPGLGICIRREQLGMSGGRDVILRFVRGLVGKDSGATQNATGMTGSDHCIMDHCSFGWGLDEGLSTRSARNVTFQRCSLSEALNIAGHQNYPAGTTHGYAASIGGDVGSFHHNLLAHNEGRNWSMAGGLDGSGKYAGRLDLFNNVVYNWGGRTTDGGAHEVNFVGNYYKPGPATTKLTILNPQYGRFPGTQRYHMAGNVLPGRFDESNQAAGLSIGTERGGVLPEKSTPAYEALSKEPLFPSFASIQTARAAYKSVLSDVGCTLPRMDARDLRIARETLDGTTTFTGSVSGKKGLPDTTADVGGWEDYGQETRPADWDTDGDGMPNWWETVHELDTGSAAGDFSETNADPDGDGYTRLEDYLNWLAQPHFECVAGGTIEVDLEALSLGYSKTRPAYKLGEAKGGDVSLASAKHARFTPSGNTDALASFAFTVTDADGDTMTRMVHLRVRAADSPKPTSHPR